MLIISPFLCTLSPVCSVTVVLPVLMRVIPGTALPATVHGVLIGQGLFRGTCLIWKSL